MVEFKKRLWLFTGTIMLAFVGLFMGQDAWIDVLNTVARKQKERRDAATD